MSICDDPIACHENLADDFDNQAPLFADGNRRARGARPCKIPFRIGKSGVIRQRHAGMQDIE